MSELDWTSVYDDTDEAPTVADDSPVIRGASGEIDWSNLYEDKPLEPQGDLSAGWSTGVESFKSLWGSAKAATGALFGNDEWITEGLAAADEADRRAAEIGEGHITNWDDVHSVSDFIDYAQFGLATLGPHALESTVGALVGGAVGTATAPGPGSAAVLLGGVVAKGALKQLVREYAKGALKGQAKDVIEKQVRADLRDYSAGKLKDAAKEKVLRQALKSSKTKVGAQLGAMASEYPMGVGDVFSSMVEGGEDAAVEDAGLAFGLAVPYALLGAAPEALGIERLFKAGSGGVLARAGKAAVVQAPAESVTEVLQGELTRNTQGAYDETFDPYGPEAAIQRREEAILGGMGGGFVGGITGAFQKDAPDVSDIQASSTVDEALERAKAIAAGGLVAEPAGPDIPQALRNQRVIDDASEGSFLDKDPLQGPAVLLDETAATNQREILQTLGVQDSQTLLPADTGEVVGPAPSPLTSTEQNQLAIDRQVENEAPTGADLDRQLRNELRRAEHLPVEEDQRKNLAATKLDKAKNTQIEDQLVEQGLAKRESPFGDEIKPKRGAYATKAAAEHALRGKRQTPDEGKQADLAQFKPVETQPGAWVLRRTPSPETQDGNPEAIVGKATRKVPAEQNRTVARTEVLTALRDAGVVGFAQQQDVFAELTPPDPAKPHEFRNADVQEVLTRYSLQEPKGPAVSSTVDSAVQAAFPTGKVSTKSDGAVSVSLPNGSVVTVLPDQQIEIDKPAARRAYGSKFDDDATASGAFTRVGRDGLMFLAKDADQGTVNHEAFHMAWQTVLNNKERSTLVKRYGSEEGSAEAYAKWKSKQKNNLFEKIMRFFRTVRDALTGPSAEGTFDTVSTGSAFTRAVDSTVAESDTVYQLNPALKAAEDRISGLEALKACLSS